MRTLQEELKCMREGLHYDAHTPEMYAYRAEVKKKLHIVASFLHSLLLLFLGMFLKFSGNGTYLLIECYLKELLYILYQIPGKWTGSAK